MACSEIKHFHISYCGDSIIVDAGLSPNTELFVCITRLRDNMLYQRRFTTDSEGVLTIERDQYQDGLFNPAAGFFHLVIRSVDNYTEIKDLTFDSVQYDSATFSIVEVDVDQDDAEAVAINSTISTETLQG